ncbi:hypothetical protein [Sphingomonas aerolata]|uniref:hypothetical protein n=1 Tax=Sphingomonas aerolata TaxID=185951 RepID=UPI00208EBB7C|nr:hypothetical protein [Sphingomonas aerolata]USR01842.1 hypothetical protein NEF64_08585 [Sphingomonas aerolata]
MTVAREQLGAQRAQARATIIAWRRSFAAEINAGNWRGRGDQLNATRKLFGMHFAGIERELMAATAPALAALDAAARFPSYDAWCAGASAPSVPQALGLAVPMVVASSGDHAAAGVPVAGYEWQRREGVCIYRRVGHPRVAALVRDGAERVRVVPDAAMRHVAALPALGMPCLCRAGEDCLLQLPAFFLPDPDETEAGLIRVAQATWKRWAEQHAAWTGHDHPARVALQALADRAAGAGDA